MQEPKPELSSLEQARFSYCTEVDAKNPKTEIIREITSDYVPKDKKKESVNFDVNTRFELVSNDLPKDDIPINPELLHPYKFERYTDYLLKESPMLKDFRFIVNDPIQVDEVQAPKKDKSEARGEVFNLDWKQRVAELRDADLTDMKTFGQMLVVLALTRGDYIALLVDGTEEHVLMVMFESEYEQSRVLFDLRKMLLVGKIPSNADMEKIPLQRMPFKCCEHAEKFNKGLMATYGKLSDDYVEHKRNFAIFLFMAPRDSKRQDSNYVGVPLPNQVEVAEIQKGKGLKPVEELRCTMCKVASSPIIEVKRCGGCRSVAYCSKTCQTADWSRHKPVCVEIKKARAHAEATSLKNM